MAEHKPSRGGNGNGNGRAALELCQIPHERRMLLLPHCLRPSEGCPGKMTRQGLICDGCTRTDCQIQPIRQAAIAAGYQSICVAPGGRLALRCVAQVRPEGIVAVACDKELQEGVAAVEALSWSDWDREIPPIYQIPLSHDGCVDTDVDVALAIETIES
jgi:geranylgeranyl diphosphate synthase type II